MTILLVGIFGYIYITTGNILPNGKFDKKYDNAIAIVKENEEEALTLFNKIDKESPNRVIEFIDSTGIPKWEENIRILNELDKIKGLYKQLLKQDELLRNYCNLRIESYRLIKKALMENSKIYDQQIENINYKIELEISKLK